MEEGIDFVCVPFSHQEALSKGMLVQYTSEIAGRVIFGECSNESL